MKAKNGVEIMGYEKILPVRDDEAFFMHLPGVYCRNCGETYALYSFSTEKPDGTDENRKPYYNGCFKCGRSLF